MKCQCFKSKAIFYPCRKKIWEFPGLTVSWTSLRSCKPTSPLSIAMCSPTLLHPLVPKTCPITYPLANHVLPFPRAQCLQTVPFLSINPAASWPFCQTLQKVFSKPHLPNLSNSSTAVGFIHSPGALWGWTCLLQHLARELLSPKGCRSYLGFPGTLLISIKNQPAKRVNLWQCRAWAEELETTHILIFRAGSSFLQNIKLSSQRKGEHLALELIVNFNVLLNTCPSKGGSYSEILKENYLLELK